MHLPHHPSTGLRALGCRRDGQPIWPILGAADGDAEGDGDGDGTGGSGGDGSADGDGKSGDGGTGDGDGGKGKAGRLRSLEELLADVPDDTRAVILAEVSKARGEARGLRNRVKELEPKAGAYEKVRAEQLSAEQKAQEAAEQAEKRARTATERAVRAEVKALAATGFADPEDAAAFLGDLNEYVNDDGDIDTEQINTDLRALLERKPHLRRPDPNNAGGRRTPAPDNSQGSSGNGNRSSTPRDEFASLLRNTLTGKQ